MKRSELESLFLSFVRLQSDLIEGFIDAAEKQGLLDKDVLIRPDQAEEEKKK